MTDVDDLLESEQRRCEAISDGNIEALSSMLSDDLTHTHITGDTDDKESYLAAVAARPRKTTRGSDLRVRVYGDAAVMTGTLRNELPAAAGAEPIVMEGHALSVWTRTASGWRQVAFASSARMPEGV